MTFQSFEQTLKQPSQLWIVLLLGLIGLLFGMSSAHALVQRGVGNLSFEEPVISTVSPCRVYLADSKVPFWETNHPPTPEETVGSCNGGTVSSPPLVAPIFEIWRGPRSGMTARSGTQFIELNAT